MAEIKFKSLRPKKERFCLRCGCTQDRACPGGCGWVHTADVCTACLTVAEHALLLELVHGYNFNRGRERKRFLNMLDTFGRYVTEITADMPIPYVVVKNKKGRSDRSGRET
jgi:hypothetical protein